jgi:outer membrane protein assembly factor BamB
VRRLLAALALVALLAGCGGAAHRPRHASSPPPPPPARPRPVAVSPIPSGNVPRQLWVHKVEVTVLDGDTGLRVPGAHVRIGRRSALADRRGVVLVPFPRHAGLVHIAAPGYVAKTIRLYFRQFPRSTVRVYRQSVQWPMYGVDAARTQVQSQIRLRPPFKIAWTRGLGGLIEFPAVVSEGVAYIGNASGTVFAVSMDDGHVIWRRETRHGEMAASAAIWGGRLVVHEMDGSVTVRRRSNGSVLERLGAGAPIESSPVVRDGIDYLGAWNGVVRALDLRRGRTIWTYDSGCKITSSAAISGSIVYIGDYCGRLLALDRATGRLRWEGHVDGRIYGTAAVAGGRVFVGSSDGETMNAFTTGGRFLWERGFGSYVYSSPAVWHGRVFFGTYGGWFYALSGSSGRTLWSVPTGGPVSGAAVVVDGVAYAGSFAHRIVGVDALSGRVVLDFPHGEYVPVSGGGEKLLLHGYSRLFAVTER